MESTETRLLRQLEYERAARQDAIRILEERLAALERKLINCPDPAEKQESSGTPGSSESDTDFESGCWEPRGRGLGELTDSYAFEESAWDATVFAFTGPVGKAVSANIIAQLFVNVIAQGFFIFVVWNFMCDESMSGDFLTSLLRFRAGVAHHVDYADSIHGISLASQICGQDERIPWAGMQFGLINDIKAAQGGWKFLCTLAVLCWLLTLIGELDSTLQFSNAITSLVRNTDSHLHVGKKDGVRLKAISPLRLMVLMVMVVIPRLLIVLCLAFVGIKFLIVTTSMGDLLLNALALAFIIDIDNMLYSAFSPLDLKSLMRDVEPVQFSEMRKRPFHLNASLKAVIVFGTLIAVYWSQIMPVYGHMSMAMEILCSGEKEFMFAENFATGMPQAVSSFKMENLNWTDTELSILQLTNMTFKPRFGYAFPKDVIEAQNGPRTAMFTLGPQDVRARIKYKKNAMHKGVSSLTPRLTTVKEIAKLDSQTVAQSAIDLACADLALSADRKSTKEHLKRITGGLTNCSQAVHLCGKLGQTALRATCPITCGCHLLLDSPAGFYAGPGYGCPTRCQYEVPGLPESKSVMCVDAQPNDFLTSKPLKKYFHEAIRALGASGISLVAIHASIVKHKDAFKMEKDAAWKGIVGINNGSFANFSHTGSWDIVPGTPHPRGLKGCQFWTSWEVKLLLGIDFCDGAWHRTLRPYCPESCGCNKVGGAFCPPSCPGPR